MKTTHTKFKEGAKVTVAECYLVDEASEHINTSAIATIWSEPTDNEELVGIRYEGGELDYVPQNILEVRFP